MADPPAKAEQGFGFLARKVGPLPVVAWGAIGVGGYLLLRRFNLFGLGSSSAAAAPAQPATPAQGQGNTIIAKIMGTPPNPGASGTATTTSSTGAATSQPSIGIVGQPIAGGYNRPGRTPIRSGTTPRNTSPATAAAQEQASAPSVYAAVPAANGAAPQTAQATTGAVPAVVYEGPVYGLWTTEQQGVQAMSGAQGTSISQTLNQSQAPPGSAVSGPPPPPGSSGGGGNPTPQPYNGPKTSLAAATSYLQSQGYTVTNVSLAGQNLDADGIAANQSTPVWSVTPYSDKTARIGLL